MDRMYVLEFSKLWSLLPFELKDMIRLDRGIKEREKRDRRNNELLVMYEQWSDNLSRIRQKKLLRSLNIENQRA